MCFVSQLTLVRLGIVFSLARLDPQPSRWRQAVSWRLCRLETARALWVLCRFTYGAYPLRANAFLLTTVLLQGRISYPPGRETSQICFFLRRKGTPFLFCWLRLAQLGIVFSLTQQGPQPSRWRPCRLTDGTYPLRVKPLFLLQESGMCLPYSWFFACPAGAKTAFSFTSKRRIGSGLRKRKGRPAEMITDCGTTERWCYAVMVSLG